MPQSVETVLTGEVECWEDAERLSNLDTKNRNAASRQSAPSRDLRDEQKRAQGAQKLVQPINKITAPP